MKPVSKPDERISSVPQSAVPNLHALLIGIDKYEHVPHLSGATNDAHHMEIFLRFDLSVPKSQIKVLKNEQATRSGILEALEQLRKDSKIQLFDPILIYYAGYGCELNSPLVGPSSSGETIQCLVPWDVRQEVAGLNAIPPIPSYTIAALLDGLAAEKGNNITLIVDCSYSAGITRGFDRDPNRAQLGSKWGATLNTAPFVGHGLERSLSQDILPALTSGTDEAILQRPKSGLSSGRWVNIMAVLCFYFIRLRAKRSNGRGSQACPSFSYFKQTIAGNLRQGRSHVLLAACGSFEQAYEHPKSKKGLFTSALLQILRSHSVDELTHKAIFEDFLPLITSRQVSFIAHKEPFIKLVKNSGQSPVCEGTSATRNFLKVPVLGQRFTSISIKGPSEGYFSMCAGDAQGVIPGSTYRIDGRGTRSRHPFGSSYQDFVIQSSDKQPGSNPLLSQFQPTHVAEKPAHPYAKLIYRGKFHSFRVFLGDRLKDHNLGALAKALRDELKRKDHGILVVDSEDQANIALDLDPEEAKHILFKPFGFPRALPHRCSLDTNKIYSILLTMAQWDWHLTRVPQDTFKPRTRLAELTIHRLGDLEPIQIPAEGMATSIPISRENRYAVKIRSLCNKRLYAYLFYFSTASQSIRPLYSRVYSSAQVDQALEPHGELMVGCEHNDTISGPLCFHNTPDTGYFRLFLTTAPSDFDSMTQPSPFLPRMMYIPTMQLGVGGEYLDGVEIVKLSPSDQLHQVEHGASYITDGGSPSGPTTIRPPESQREKALDVGNPLRLGISEAELVRMLQEEAKTLWDVVSLKVILTKPALAPGPALYKTTSDKAAKIQARTMESRVIPWFRSPTFTRESLSSNRFMKLRTLTVLGLEGNAFNGNPGGYFEISVLAPDGLPKLKSIIPEIDITYQSHTVPANSTPQWTDGMIFGKGHEVWKHLEVGDCFEVSACVRGRGWTLDAQQGELVLW